LRHKIPGDAAGLVTPDTIHRWYRTLVATKCDGVKRRAPGRPTTGTAVAELVVTMAMDALLVADGLGVTPRPLCPVSVASWRRCLFPIPRKDHPCLEHALDFAPVSVGIPRRCLPYGQRRCLWLLPLFTSCAGLGSALAGLAVVTSSTRRCSTARVATHPKAPYFSRSSSSPARFSTASPPRVTPAISWRQTHPPARPPPSHPVPVRPTIPAQPPFIPLNALSTHARLPVAMVG